MAADPSFQIIASSLDLERSKICTHCHTGITSLWRNGPSGSKSLCNACGLRYQRKGMEALDSESKGCKGKITKKGMEGTQRQRKVIKLKSNGKNGKKTKTKQPDEVDLRGMLTTTGCWKEMMMPQIQQHGEEEVKAAIQLMNLSGATFC